MILKNIVRINHVCFPFEFSDVFGTCSASDIRLWNSKTRQELLRIQVYTSRGGGGRNGIYKVVYLFSNGDSAFQYSAAQSFFLWTRHSNRSILLLLMMLI